MWWSCPLSGRWAFSRQTNFSRLPAQTVSAPSVRAYEDLPLLFLLFNYNSNYLGIAVPKAGYVATQPDRACFTAEISFLVTFLSHRRHFHVAGISSEKLLEAKHSLPGSPRHLPHHPHTTPSLCQLSSPNSHIFLTALLRGKAQMFLNKAKDYTSVTMGTWNQHWAGCFKR